MSNGRGPAIGWGIILLGLAVRCIYLYESSANPAFRMPLVDSYAYDRAARTFADHGGMGLQFFWQPFFYPFFLAVVYLMSGGSILCAKLLQAGLGAVTCGLSYQLGAKIFDRRTGIIAGVITAFYGPLFFFEAELLATAWEAFWGAALVWLFLATAQKNKWWYGLLLGVVGGLSIITRPTFLPFLGAGGVWLVIKTRSQKRLRAGKAAAAFLGVLLIILPVGWAGRYITGRFTFLPISGGLNLYIGNNPNYCETLTARPGPKWIKLISLPSRYGIGPDEHQRSKFFRDRVIEYAKQDPAGFMRGMARKGLEFLNSREIPRNFDIYMFGHWSGVLRLLTWKAGGFGFPFGVILPLALVGLIWQRRRIPGVVFLFLVFYPLSIILVFVASRYKVVIIPVLSILAGAGLITIVQMLRAKRWRTVAVISILGLVVILISTLPGPFCEEKPNFKAEFALNIGDGLNQRGQPDKAFEYYTQALQLQGDSAEAHLNLGMLLMQQGKLSQAIGHYQQALKTHPEYAEVHYAYGIALCRENKLAQAVEHLKSAVELRPDYPEAQHVLGAALAQQGKVAEGIKHFEEAVRLQPKNFLAHHSLGLALTQMQKFEEAIEHFQTALQLNSNLPETSMQLAQAHAAYGTKLAGRGQSEQAVIHWSRAVQIEDNLVNVHKNLAWALAVFDQASFHNPDQATRHGRRACQLTAQKDPEMLDCLAIAYGAAGNFSQAINTAQKALELARQRGQENLARKIAARLQLYQTRKPYREDLPLSIPSD